MTPASLQRWLKFTTQAQVDVLQNAPNVDLFEDIAQSVSGQVERVLRGEDIEKPSEEWIKGFVEKGESTTSQEMDPSQREAEQHDSVPTQISG